MALLAAGCGSADDDDGADAHPASTAADESTHRGVTDEAINFGFIYVSGNEQFAASIGIQASSGSTLGQIEAVVEAVNAEGGVAGREVRLVPFELRSGEPVDSQLQAACSYFTEDNQVFAVSGNADGLTGGKGEVLYDCLASDDVILIETASPGDTEAYDRYPNIAYAPANFNADRAASLLIDALEEDGWFGDEPVIGLHTIESPMYRRVIDAVVVPKLEEYGYTVAEEFNLRLGPAGPENLGDYGAAVLRFKEAGVTHVVNIGGAVALFFAQAAEPQGYRPRWSVYTDMAPSAWSPAMPPGQLEGALGIGWYPAVDVLPADRGEPVNRAETRCQGIMQAAGEDTTPPLAWLFQLHACSSVFFLQAALDAAPELTTAGFADGVAALGDEYLDPATFEAQFESGRRDGPTAYRMLGYVEACACLQYVSDLIAVP